MVGCNVIVEGVCRLPRDHISDDKSSMQLAEECGLFEHPECVTLSATAAYLRAHPDLVDDSIIYSENQRSSECWYFCEEGNKFVVGFRTDVKKRKKQRYPDRISACAQFVIYQMEVLLTIAAHDRSRSRSKPR
jgi:hypothetical protein